MDLIKNKILGEKSYFAIEESRKLELIKLPLLKLVLENLPFLEPTILDKENSWEKIAVIIQTEFPQEDLNYGGFYFKDKFQSMFDEFTKRYRLDLIRDIGVRPDGTNYNVEKILECNIDKLDFYLYQIYKLKNLDIKFEAELAKENYEKRLRERFNERETLVIFDKDEENNKKDKMINTMVLNKKISYLENEISKRDQSINRLIDDNKKLQDLLQIELKNHR